MFRSQLAVSGAMFHVRYLPAQFVDANHSALDERLRDGMHPSLVVAERLVGRRAEPLDVATEFVHRHVTFVVV